MMTVYVFHSTHKVNVSEKTAAKRKVVNPVEKNPLIQFNYPKSQNPYTYARRVVRLIASNAKYYMGLEVTDKNRFKKFLRSKAFCTSILEFNPKALVKQ